MHFTPLLQSLDGSHAPSATETLYGADGVRNRRRSECGGAGGKRDTNKVSVQDLTVNCGAAAASCFLLSPE